MQDRSFLGRKTFMGNTLKKFEIRGVLVITGAIMLSLILYQVPKQHADDMAFAQVAGMAMVLGTLLLCMVVPVDDGSERFTLARIGIASLVAAGGLVLIVVLGEFSQEYGEWAAIIIGVMFILAMIFRDE